jgi:hypothetical protein
VTTEFADLESVVGLGASETWAAFGDLGDGLPFAAAEAGLVERMVRAIGRYPEDVVIDVPPLRQPLTVRSLAICAALAGCEPDYLPVIAAAVSALTDPELNAYGFTTTTGSAAPLVLVNGPVVERVGFNSGANCLGPGNRANATVGRCVSLVLRLVGGARSGFADMATLGQPAKYTCCFAENEAGSPWEAFHVEHGLGADQSAVTVTAMSGIVETFEASTGVLADMVDSIAIVLAGSAPMMELTGPDSGLVGGGQPLVVITPEWAVEFDRQGCSKASLREALFERAVRERRGDVDLRIALNADDILIVVAGGVGVKQAVIPNWNGGSRAVTVPVAG